MFWLSERHVAELQDTLLAWFRTVARPLPWRSERTVYGTWIAEIMLQQTTVAVVEAYWRRFLARFPDVRTLAAADEQEVLALWSGLGYYRRARHLHQAARRIVAGGGQLPADRRAWALLPGIGPYAAGAIASQALGEAVPAVDANARRVLTRWLVDDPGRLGALTPRALEAAAGSLVPPHRPGPWNEAVMELGALVCRARQADCGNCPVLHLCRAGLAGRADEIPAPAGPRETSAAQVAVLVVRRGGEVFLTRPGAPPSLDFEGNLPCVRQDFQDLHQGLWGLPQTVWVVPQDRPPRPRLSRALHEILRGNLPPNHVVGEDDLRVVGEFRHAITRYRLRVQVFSLDLGARDAGEMGVNEVDFAHAAGYPRAKEIFSDLSDELDIGCFVPAGPGKPLTSLARKALTAVGGSPG